MKLETIYKEMLKVKEAKNVGEWLKRFNQLLQKVEYAVEREREKREKYGKVIQHLMGWYISLWQGKPPESFGRTDWQGATGKTIRELIIIYENNNLDIEKLKSDYESFKNTTDRKMQYLKGDSSITRFRQVLPTLKKQIGSNWVSETYKHNDSIYGKVFNADDLEEEPFEDCYKEEKDGNK